MLNWFHNSKNIQEMFLMKFKLFLWRKSKFLRMCTLLWGTMLLLRLKTNGLMIFWIFWMKRIWSLLIMQTLIAPLNPSWGHFISKVFIVQFASTSYSIKLVGPINPTVFVFLCFEFCFYLFVLFVCLFVCFFVIISLKLFCTYFVNVKSFSPVGWVMFFNNTILCSLSNKINLPSPE